VIKTEKELLRLIWKEMGLGGHNADLKRRSGAAKEVHKAVDYMMNNTTPDEKEYVFDALASLFLSRINEMGREDFTKIFYQELLLTMSKKKG
jgi:hypothetical protein